MTTVLSRPKAAPTLQPQAPAPQEPTLAARARVSRVDYARGVAIVLVVVGHVAGGLWATGLPDDRITGLLQSLHLRNSFRMPALFMLAGIFAERSLRKGATGFAIEKVRYLLYPYVLWNLIAWSVIAGANWFGQATGVKLINTAMPDPWAMARMFWMPLGHWFLYTLLIAFLVYAILRKVGMGFASILVLAFGVYVVARLELLRDIPMISELGKRFFFLSLGAALADRLLDIGHRAKWWQPAISAVCFAGAMVWLASTNTMSQAVADLEAGIELSPAVNVEQLNKLVEQLPIRLGVSLTGIAALWSLAIVFERLRGPKIIEYWGRISMEIYVLSAFGMVSARAMLYRGLHQQAGLEFFGHPWVLLLGGITGGLALPMLIVWVTRRLDFNYLFRWGRSSAKSPAPADR